MTLTECNHVITEVCSVLQAMPETLVLTLPVKKELVPILVKLRLKNEFIETSV